jgi:NTP pyrophosphatase (non-canonical NTP hydrolase)
MVLHDIQSEIGEWSIRNFGPTKEDHAIDQLLGIGEEYGELLHSVLKRRQGIRDGLETLGSEELELEEDAIGDLLIYLLDYCYRQGIEVTDVLEHTWRIVKQRDWVKYPKSGRPE